MRGREGARVTIQAEAGTDDKHASVGIKYDISLFKGSHGCCPPGTGITLNPSETASLNSEVIFRPFRLPFLNC